MLFRLLPELQCDSDFMVAVRETIWDQELHANTLSYHHHVSSERVGKVRHWGMAVGVWRLTLRTVSWLIPHIPTAGWERDRGQTEITKNTSHVFLSLCHRIKPSNPDDLLTSTSADSCYSDRLHHKVRNKQDKLITSMRVRFTWTQ